MKQIDTIRAALEQAGEYIRSDLASERGAFEGHEGVSRIDEIKADLANNAAALAALAELEKACADAELAVHVQRGIADGYHDALKIWRQRAEQAEARLAAIDAAPPADLGLYDAGQMNDYGGGNVEWWWDYMRAELGRAHDFYTEQAGELIARPAKD